MSFKREGDDFGWLERIRKRRVDELLSVSIPEEEALLMKNGRFCCVVCPNRPIFDTVNMLMVHRGGKNHVRASEKAEQEKVELELLKLKRQQETYLATGEGPGNTLVQKAIAAKSLTLASSAPYEPRLKKKKIHERKERINIGQTYEGDNFQDFDQSTSSNDKYASTGPKFSITDSGKLDGPQTISHYVKLKSADNSLETVKLTPYGSANKNNVSMCMNSSTKVIRLIGSSNQHPSSSTSKSVSIPHTSQHHKAKRKITSQEKDSSSSKNSSSNVPADLNKLITAEKYLQARGAGWKKDLSGKWVQEEGVEFDSDEEPPDLP